MTYGSIPKNTTTQNNYFWHTKTVDEVIDLLNTDTKTGITEEEARRRLEKFGYNELEEKRGRSPLKIFISQFNDFMIWILIAAAFVSGFLIREVLDAIVILVILVINATLGFIQEFRAEKALQALKELSAPTAKVIREGVEKNINSKLLVPGDIIKLSVGDLVPADCRIIEETNLLSDESLITGESLPVEKTTSQLEDQSLPIGDRKNMLFSGTTIVKGRCKAVIVETGNKTEIGKIASLVQEKEELTPLQKELKVVGKKIGFICLAVSAIVFLSGILKGNEIANMLLVAVALAVASIPEGLPAIVTVSLALGVQRMAKNNAIVRRLSSVETLGAVTVICTDKTGTLTENRMKVRKIFTGLEEFDLYEKILKYKSRDIVKTEEDNKNNQSQNNDFHEVEQGKFLNTFENNLALKLLVENAVLCNDAYYQDKTKRTFAGDPTEVALLEMGETFSLNKSSLESKKPRLMEEPFDSIRKMMSTIHEISEDNFFPEIWNHTQESHFCKSSAQVQGNQKNSDMPGKPKYILFSKGAPEVILEKCSKIIKNNKIEDLTLSDKKEIQKINSQLAEKAMRNLAFAFKYLDIPPPKNEVKSIEKDLIYCGVVGMIDPPRPEVYDAVEKCKKANIKVVMVTGDHKLTAKAIGEEIGIVSDNDIVIDGEEFNKLSKEEREEMIENIKIFARVSPSTKVEIVDELRKKHHLIAMTGDGVNDAPSLKKADIGIAMGITGTDVSKESSDMILTDDNFATIVKAVKEGRVIYDNLRKFILFLLSCNISEVLLMFIAIVFGDYIFYLITGNGGYLYVPLLPVQILWMNLITDGLPAMALGVDPPEKDVMERKATKEREPILSKRRLTIVTWQGLILTLGALFAYFAGPFIFYGNQVTQGTTNNVRVFQTIVFTTLVFAQLLHTYNYRFEKKGMFSKHILENMFLNLAVMASALLQIAIIYVPFLQNVFNTAPLNIEHWTIILGSSIVSVFLINFINEITYKRKSIVVNEKTSE
ncbi:MAG: cation-translocating P-type ATPase [Actinobacteria bacterium]|nr:cation-translocating P-type ATPase [Actinomycetota bacterium]